jgi:ankyrin repeat protein
MKPTLSFTSKEIAIFSDLHRQCNRIGSQDDLKWELKNSLENCPLDRRVAIVCRKFAGFAPLFKACRVGNVKVARFLVEKCFADLEQKGLCVDESHKYHKTTPLWCAAVKGYKLLVEYLLLAGANIDAVTDTGSTPVRSACYSSHLEIVKVLVEHGADITKPNHNGGTCLINSVQSVELCKFLLENSAPVNGQDIQFKTAAHYSVEEGFADTFEELVAAGADLTLKSIDGDDALQVACITGREEFVLKMFKFEIYSDEVRSNMLSLLGSSIYETEGDIAWAMQYWKDAMEFNVHWDEHSPVAIVSDRVFAGKRECRTKEELNSIADDVDSIRIQSLLVTQRVLGWHHRETFSRLLMRGGAYVENGRYEEALWICTELVARQIQRDSLVGDQSMYTTIISILQLMAMCCERQDEQVPESMFQSTLYVIEMMMNEIPKCREWLLVNPVSIHQMEVFDLSLGCISYFLHFAAVLRPLRDQKVNNLVRQLGSMDSRAIETGSTMLHHAVSVGLHVRSKGFTWFNLPKVFPSIPLLNCLLQSNWNPNVTDHNGATPLHYASPHAHPQRTEIVTTLLNAGAHVDQVNSQGYSAYESLNKILGSQPVLSLQCLSARAICQHIDKDDPMDDSRYQEVVSQLPHDLRKFLLIHKKKCK